MKYQAIITINIDARDAYDVQAQRERLDQVTADLKAEHADARLVLKARRPRLSARAAPPAKLGPEFEIIRARYVG